MSIRSVIHNLKFNKWNLAFVEEGLDEIVRSKSVKVHYMKGNIVSNGLPILSSWM